MALNGGLQWAVTELLKRQTSDSDPDDPGNASEKEQSASWALFILIMLLIAALFTSYILQTRKIQAVHETVVSIFAGMVVGLVLRVVADNSVLSVVSFDYQFFFNLLLPPIILGAGYELHQANFFRSIGSILTFAFAGTFISAIVLGLILYLWTRIPLDDMDISFVEAISVGATLSATDPVTILAIFNTYKVDPQLYTLIFGESILNDAIAIVLFETAQKYTKGAASDKLTVFSFFESIGYFLFVFFASLAIGLVVGIATSLILKFTHVRRFPKIESCLILLIAYASYFFANAITLSGIVSLLFCGICLKHYAYHNMSRRTQLTTKFVFQVTAQLSENFIFIYLGLSLFTERELEYKPLFIFITVIGICAARWCAVFPLSKIINVCIRYRARRNGREPEEIPYAHQAMLFWAGLRGAVGVALAAGLSGKHGYALRATVLVVVVLTVIIFGGTTARMLEILGIKTGVVDEIDSDDEFDIEVVRASNVDGSTYQRRGGTGYGHMPSRSPNTNGFPLSPVEFGKSESTYVSGNNANGASPPTRPNGTTARRPSSRSQRDAAGQGLLSPNDSGSLSGDEADLDLPPSARRSPARVPSPNSRSASRGAGATRGGAGDLPAPVTTNNPYPTSSGEIVHPHGTSSRVATATGAISQLWHGLNEDPASAFRQIDEGFIKPHLLLDPGSSNKGGHGSSNV